MFLKKVNQLADDWGRSKTDMCGVTRESLLYGMRLTRHPSSLKKELKLVDIDSKEAKPLWSGNAYLLLELPQVLLNKKRKIPCLEDLHYARKVLTKDQMKTLRKQVRGRCKISREELFKELLPKIKQLSWKGRFITQFDAQYEHLLDVETDLAIRALEILNKEFSNFKTTNKEKIVAYLSYCLSSKSKTYLRESTPKNIKARIEPEDFDRIIHDARTEDAPETSQVDVEFKKDLKALLSENVYRGIALLMGIEDRADQRGFAIYLKNLKLDISGLNQGQIKHHIEKYIGEAVFAAATDNEQLKNFLMNRTHSELHGGTDATDYRYA